MPSSKILPTKHDKRTGLKIIALRRDPEPSGSRVLKGELASYRRADIGEYRIIYFVDGDCLRIPVIGERNDGAVYHAMARKLR